MNRGCPLPPCPLSLAARVSQPIPSWARRAGIAPSVLVLRVASLESLRSSFRAHYLTCPGSFLLTMSPYHPHFMEKFSSLPKVMQLIRGRIGLSAQKTMP